MSNHTMFEINHDTTPHTDAELITWAKQFQQYLSSGDIKLLPQGVTWFGMRHHTEPCLLPTNQPKIAIINNKSKEVRFNVTKIVTQYINNVCDCDEFAVKYKAVVIKTHIVTCKNYPDFISHRVHIIYNENISFIEVDNISDWSIGQSVYIIGKVERQYNSTSM